MPDVGAFGPSLLILGVVVVMLWFAFGTSRNITRGNDLLRWLQGGLHAAPEHQAGQNDRKPPNSHFLPRFALSRPGNRPDSARRY